MGGFTTRKGLWNLARENMLQDRGALPKEDGDVIGEYKAMHEENLLSNWLRKDGRTDREEEWRQKKKTKEEMSKKRTREEEKEENETESSIKRCVGIISAEAFDIFSQGEDLESCGGVSWRDLLENPDDLSPAVTDVPVSSSSVVTEC